MKASTNVPSDLDVTVVGTVLGLEGTSSYSRSATTQNGVICSVVFDTHTDDGYTLTAEPFGQAFFERSSILM
jgi:hypothetical protein